MSLKIKVCKYKKLMSWSSLSAAAWFNTVNLDVLKKDHFFGAPILIFYGIFSDVICVYVFVILFYNPNFLMSLHETKYI